MEVCGGVGYSPRRNSRKSLDFGGDPLIVYSGSLSKFIYRDYRWRVNWYIAASLSKLWTDYDKILQRDGSDQRQNTQIVCWRSSSGSGFSVYKPGSGSKNVFAIFFFVLGGDLRSLIASSSEDSHFSQHCVRVGRATAEHLWVSRSTFAILRWNSEPWVTYG